MTQVIAIILSCYTQYEGFDRPELIFFQQAPGEVFNELVVRIFRTIQTHSAYFIPFPEEYWHENDSLYVSVKCTREDHYPSEIRKALEEFFGKEGAVLYLGKVW